MKKLKGPLNVAFINRTFFPEYLDKSIINQGECFLWAYIAYRLYKNVELWDMGAHAFVRSKRNKKFYDSERPKGEKNWKDLPACNFGVGCGCGRCATGSRKHKTAGKFRRSWGGMAKRHETNWEEIHRKIIEVINES